MRYKLVTTNFALSITDTTTNVIVAYCNQPTVALWTGLIELCEEYNQLEFAARLRDYVTRRATVSRTPRVPSRLVA